MIFFLFFWLKKLKLNYQFDPYHLYILVTKHVHTMIYIADAKDVETHPPKRLLFFCE